MDASASGMEAFGSEAAIGGHELISSHARITTLDEAYAALGEVLRGWRAAGRVTTTAGVGAELKNRGLDVGQLGLPSLKEFWELADQRGVVCRHRQANGHWLLLLPGEPRRDATVAGVSRSQAAVSSESGADRPTSPMVQDNRWRHALPRLKPLVWRAFVDWDEGYRRFWDRAASRPFMVPTAWVPAEIDPRVFLTIDPVTQATQLDWMRAFAAGKEGALQRGLEDALGSSAPVGAFRRVLDLDGSARDWHVTLAQHVGDVVAAWGEKHDIPRQQLFEPGRPKPPPPYDVEGARRSQPSMSPRPSVAATCPADARGTGAVEDLRGRVHRAVDAMPYDELATLPVRAWHLLT